MLLENDKIRLKSAKGLRIRVDMACKDCIYDPQASGNWRQQVSACTVIACPLYEVRPQSKPRKTALTGVL